MQYILRDLLRLPLQERLEIIELLMLNIVSSKDQTVAEFDPKLLTELSSLLRSKNHV